MTWWLITALGVAGTLAFLFLLLKLGANMMDPR